MYNKTKEYETEYDCDSIINLVLTVLDSPEVTIAGNTQIYAGESTTLTASGADSYVWSTGETSASITVEPSETTKYSVVGTKNGCDNEAEVTVNVTVGIDENLNVNTKLYPNPTDGDMKIECKGMKEISVFMPNGQCMEKLIVNEDVYTLDMSEYKSGVYYLRITNNNGTQVYKTVKM